MLQNWTFILTNFQVPVKSNSCYRGKLNPNSYGPDALFFFVFLVKIHRPIMFKLDKNAKTYFLWPRQRLRWCFTPSVVGSRSDDHSWAGQKYCSEGNNMFNQIKFCPIMGALVLQCSDHCQNKDEKIRI